MKYFLLVLTATSIVLCSPLNNRIFGGDSVSPGQFPFIVSLRDPDHFCGGSIINDQWVVTAAHCTKIVTNTTTVLAGTTLQHSGGIEYNITNVVAHEGFNYVEVKDDIGLIQIDGTFEYTDRIQPVEFGIPDENTTCIVAGWGVVETLEWPEELQDLEVTALSLDVCAGLIGNISELYLGPEQVCAIGGEGRGACYADSGGPLICEGRLAGIVSYSPDPCAKGYPEVYTRPSSYVEWMQKIMEP